VKGGGAVIKLIRWLKNKLSRSQSGPGGFPERRSSDSGVDRHDLNQEWEKMDKLAPWAEAEIDRLQSRLKLPKTERF